MISSSIIPVTTFTIHNGINFFKFSNISGSVGFKVLALSYLTLTILFTERDYRDMSFTNHEIYAYSILTNIKKSLAQFPGACWIGIIPILSLTRLLLGFPKATAATNNRTGFRKK